MTYESDAVASLQEAGQRAYGDAWEAGASFAKAATALSKTSDVVEALQRMIDLLVRAEALHDTADAAVKDIRAKLAETMEATGATTVQGTHHAAHLARKPAFVSIDEENLIPAEFLVTKQIVDKKAIASAIKDGISVPGASLLTPNQMALVLRARKEDGRAIWRRQNNNSSNPPT